MHLTSQLDYNGHEENKDHWSTHDLVTIRVHILSYNTSYNATVNSDY